MFYYGDDGDDKSSKNDKTMNDDSDNGDEMGDDEKPPMNDENEGETSKDMKVDKEVKSRIETAKKEQAKGSETPSKSVKKIVKPKLNEAQDRRRKNKSLRETGSRKITVSINALIIALGVIVVLLIVFGVSCRHRSAPVKAKFVE